MHVTTRENTKLLKTAESLRWAARSMLIDGRREEVEEIKVLEAAILSFCVIRWRLLHPLPSRLSISNRLGRCL
jgi:hypothetical protein